MKKSKIPESPGSELSDNIVLRRYLDLSKFIDMLRTNKIYFRRSDLLEDKFEGSMTPALRDAIKEAFLTANPESSDGYINFKQTMREGIYLNCWTQGLDDNMALWQLYGKSDSSVAVTTTVGKLKNSIKNTQNASIHKVRYINHWSNPLLGLDPFLQIFAYKLRAYKYENEVRIIYNKHNEEGDKSNFRPSGIHLDVDLNKLLRSVVVSPNAPTWFLELVKDIISKYSIKVPVNRSKLSFDPI